MKIKAGIVGGSGYTGAELLRLLIQHTQVEIIAITSRTESGVALSKFFPFLRKHTNLVFSDPDTVDMTQCDLVFFATPHGVAMQHAEKLLSQGVRIIDLSADFRLKNPSEFEHYYGIQHKNPSLLSKSVYGLPEINRASIANAQLIGLPGCYPTAVQLGFLPLMDPLQKSSTFLIDYTTLIADCKSGVSGAGRSARVPGLFTEVSEDFKAYGLPEHRHLPEMVQGLRTMSGQDLRLTFVPHLVPMIRGIHATLYARLTSYGKSIDLQNLYQDRFKEEPFIDILPAGEMPNTHSVRGTNLVRIAVHPQKENDLVIILVVQDNLVKGASGQAVQVMNIMFNLPEETGLKNLPTFP